MSVGNGFIPVIACFLATIGCPVAHGADGILYRQDFEQYSQESVYTRSDWTQDWSTSPWSYTRIENGIDEGRVSIVRESDQTFIRVRYPGGVYGPGDGGAQWLVVLPADYDSLYCSYRIRFGENFQFTLGGKLPGLCAVDRSTNTLPTGGRLPTGSNGMSARMMWKSGGSVIQYVYAPSTMSGSYPGDIPWNRTFSPGLWHSVETLIVMNTPGIGNGVIRSWFDGELALDKTDVRFRDVGSFGVNAFYFSTFFGGNDSGWAPASEQHIDFDDITVSRRPMNVQTVGVKDSPREFDLFQNTPNPFNPKTDISFSIAGDAFVSLDIYAVSGQKIDAVVRKHLRAGKHTVSWDGSKFPSGVYIYKLKSGSFSVAKKMVLLNSCTGFPKVPNRRDTRGFPDLSCQEATAWMPLFAWGEALRNPS